MYNIKYITFEIDVTYCSLSIYGSTSH